jgi:hypothetical protein
VFWASTGEWVVLVKKSEGHWEAQPCGSRQFVGETPKAAAIPALTSPRVRLLLGETRLWGARPDGATLPELARSYGVGKSNDFASLTVPPGSGVMRLAEQRV